VIARRLVLAAGLLAAILLAAGCSASGSSSAASATSAPTASAPASAGTPVSLTIYGAASLKGVLEQVKAAYATAAPDVTLTISTDSSAALQTQIEQGAPADVFLSADTTNPRKLVDKGLTAGPAVEFAGNSLTIIVPAANPAAIATPGDLARPGVKIIAAGDEVPITKYATQLVENLSKQAGAPADLAAAYAANIVSKEDNVGAVVAKIEVGEGDAAIVYRTDAKAAGGVTAIDVPRDANVPATYAGVAVKASRTPDAARAFLTWLAGPDGQAVLASFGFQPPAD
jgi:molybdate transport system substrate-binding protein